MIFTSKFILERWYWARFERLCFSLQNAPKIIAIGCVTAKNHGSKVVHQCQDLTVLRKGRIRIFSPNSSTLNQRISALRWSLEEFLGILDISVSKVIDLLGFWMILTNFHVYQHGKTLVRSLNSLKIEFISEKDQNSTKKSSDRKILQTRSKEPLTPQHIQKLASGSEKQELAH